MTLVVHNGYTAYLFLWCKLVEIKGKCLTLPHSIPVITSVNVGELESVGIVLAQVLLSPLIYMVDIGTSGE